jgi:hypothetical protein
MVKNWSRIALASFMVLLLGASAAFATTARVRSLANVGDYISDDSNVNRWYSTLPAYANQVNAELGDWTMGLVDTRGLGWTHACGDDAKYGTYRISLNEASVSHPGFWVGNPFYQMHAPMDFGGDLADPTGVVFLDTPLNRWDIAGGWELGEQIALGLAITQSKWKYEYNDDTPTTLKGSNSWITVGGGFSWTNNDNMVFDAAVNVGMAGGEADNGTDKVEWDSKNAFDLLARLFYDWQEDVTLVPVAEFTSSNYSLKTSPQLPAPNGRKTTDFMVGLGLNMDVNQDNLLVFAIEVMNRKFEDSNDTTTSVTYKQTYLPTMRLALESHITSNITTRIGAAKYLVTDKYEFDGGDESIGTGTPFDITDPSSAPSSFDWFLGCGFNVAEWTIDLELADQTPFSLGYWLTGYSAWPFGGDGPVGRISAVYNY